MKVLLICGPWGSGTTAIAGMATRMGAVGFNPDLHFMTNDPNTPDSYEFIPFRDIDLRHVDQPTMSVKSSAPEAIRAGFIDLQQPCGGQLEAQLKACPGIGIDHQHVKGLRIGCRRKTHRLHRWRW